MIALLEGVLVDVSSDGAILDVGGVGYRVAMPTSSIAMLPERGRRVRVHTHLVVRDDAMALYGFPTVEHRDLFTVLIGVNGIGPKGALAVLSVHTPEAFRKAVAEEDLGALTMIPGVGRKTAARIVIDLKEKLASIGIDGVPGGAPPEMRRLVSDAKDALEALGYSAGEAKDALAHVTLDEHADPGSLVRAALKVLAR